MNNNSDHLWLKKAEILSWEKKPKIALKRKQNNYFTWFEDGKINAAYNCLEKNLNAKLHNKDAIIFISSDKKIIKISYEELKNAVDNFCYFLKSKKLHKINSVLIHSSASLEACISMLAFSKLGIHFSVVFEELEVEALKVRCDILKPNLIISRSNDKILINKFRFINKNIIKFINFSNNFSNLKNVINYEIDLNYFKDFPYSFFPGDRKFFSLFTSGSTGIPKGVTHKVAGYLLYAKLTSKNQFGMKENSIILTASDAGWINGHTYSLFGPLANGSTTIILEKPTLILNKEIFDKIVKDLKATIIYLPVTLIRMLKAINPKLKFSHHSLKCLGTMGEPLSPKIANWFRKIFSKKLNIINTYFQTETSGIIYSHKYNDKEIYYEDGSCGKPVNKFLKIIKPEKEHKKFELKLKHIWPGCLSGIINSNDQYQKYWDKNGNFCLFDFGSISKKKNLFVYGRIDDVLNIRGHRLGSAEVESVIIKLGYIREVCAISTPDTIEGEKIVLFLSLSKITDKNIIEHDINKMLINYFGSFAIPKNIFILNELPKTRSGKILRRLLRNMYNFPNKKIGDVSTIMNLDTLKDAKKKLNEQHE